MKSLTAGNLEDCLLDQVDLRRQWISQIVEEVQKVIHHLTAEISTRDIRFQAVPYSDTYNGNIKVGEGRMWKKWPLETAGAASRPLSLPRHPTELHWDLCVTTSIHATL